MACVATYELQSRWARAVIALLFLAVWRAQNRRRTAILCRPGGWGGEIVGRNGRQAALAAMEKVKARLVHWRAPFAKETQLGFREGVQKCWVGVV